MQPDLIAHLEKKLADRPLGRFHFPDLYGPEWHRLTIGSKVKLGRAFLGQVRDGRFPGVHDSGEKHGGARVYTKT